MKFILSLAVTLATISVMAQPSVNTSIQRVTPQSNFPYAIYSQRAPGDTNAYTGEVIIGVPSPYFPQYYSPAFSFTVRSNFYGLTYSTNLIAKFGYPQLGGTNTPIGWINTGTSNLLAGTAGASTTGYTNSNVGNVQVSWYHATGTVGAGVYSNVYVNGSIYLLSTNDSGMVILQPNETIQWGGGAGAPSPGTGVKFAVKPF